MSEVHIMEEQKERAILLAVDTGSGYDTEAGLEELKELADTAGAVVVGRIVQNREKVHTATYVGKGKIEEIKDLIFEEEADTVICDDELSPAQIGNLEQELEVKVIDRTVLILDIFASRAKTREGKIQVELAQLKYRASRLVGLRRSLSRLGGTSAGMGIGNKGPGEKKLELDRRTINERIAHLKSEIKDIVRAREVIHRQRERNAVLVAAIVGYTNAGKSTLLNNLTGAEVMAEDKLFATLDTTTREYEYENGQKVLFTDTVGFINKLPHHLIDAFRSTLEEAGYADIILHVVDISNPDCEHQMKVVYDTLHRLEILDKPVITVFNKIDKAATEENIWKDDRSERTVHISAKEKRNFGGLCSVIEEVLNQSMISFEKTFSYQEANKIPFIRKYGRLLEEDYREDGIFIKAMIPHQFIGKLAGRNNES